MREVSAAVALFIASDLRLSLFVGHINAILKMLTKLGIKRVLKIGQRKPPTYAAFLSSILRYTSP